MSERRPPVTESAADLAHVVDRNIGALLERRRHEERTKSFQDRLADGITRFTGSMKFVFLHLAVFGLWTVINAGWIPGLPRFDPTFVLLATLASVEAIFLSTFVLISQNRMAALADKRADLDLQVSLLAEHEITRTLELVTQIARRLELEGAHRPELEELAKDVAPEAVLDRIEDAERALVGAGKDGERR
jgi:uncharacterized membrane protein